MMIYKVDTRETKEAIIEEAIRATKEGLYLACLLYFI
jgi:hypothetical protein